MKYLCLVYHTETVLAAMPAADLQGLVDAHLDYDDVLRGAATSSLVRRSSPPTAP